MSNSNLAISFGKGEIWVLYFYIFQIFQKFLITYFLVEFAYIFLIQAARGGINVETERGAARTVSVLTLAAVTQNDVGNYSCRPTEGRSATVTLIVEEG